MPSWFSKVFTGTPGQAPATQESASPLPEVEEEIKAPEPRRVVNAPVIVDQAETGAPIGEVRIKAKVGENGMSCTFLLDRPVIEGHSCWVPDEAVADERAPLAKALFNAGGVAGVMLHDTTISVMRDPEDMRGWEELAKALGNEIRAHFQSGMPIVSEDFLESIPPEDELRERLQEVIDDELNPGIAGHGGYITLNRIEGNTAYITMGGGCQGCAASSVTLRQGVHAAFRSVVPSLGAILDETDHAAGTNPYFQQMPAGMEG